MARHHTKRSKHHAMNHGCFGSSAVAAGHSRTFRQIAFKLVLLTFLNDSAVKATIEEDLDLSVNVRLHRTLKQALQFRSLFYRKPRFKGFESTFLFIGCKGFPPDNRRDQHCKDGTRATLLPSKIRFD